MSQLLETRLLSMMTWHARGETVYQIRSMDVEARIEAKPLPPRAWIHAFLSKVEANCAAGLHSRLVTYSNRVLIGCIPFNPCGRIVL